MALDLEIPTPRWALPLTATETSTGAIVRYLGAWGGRGSGKSHEFAGKVVEAMVADPDCSVVCIREIQKSLTLSAKKLIEAKIEQFGVGHMFDVLKTEIRRVGGKGICIFQGMQDHTADSVKSLEGFDIAWVEEAQSLSQRSMDLLRPTIRKEGSQIWFSWNPRRRSDPVERLLRGPKGPRSDAIVVRANYTDNPWLPDTLRREAEDDRITDPEGFAHTWLGDYENMGSKVVIPAAWVRSAVGLAQKIGIEVTGKTYGALDVAGAEDGGDENAFAWRKGIEIRSVETWNGLDTALTTQKAARMATAAGVAEMYYDSVGVGEGVTGEWASMGRRGEQPAGLKFFPWSAGASPLNPDDRVEPGNPQSPLNKDQYHNLKAQAWFAMRKRFENAHKAACGRSYDAEMLISIPEDMPGLAQLEEEMTQPQHKTSGTGKTMVDKQPDDARSPNMADAVVMAFWPVSSTYDWTGAI
jgi:hypothetical protein